MVGIPQTGDFSMVWYAVAILSALGLAVLALKSARTRRVNPLNFPSKF